MAVYLFFLFWHSGLLSIRASKNNFLTVRKGRRKYLPVKERCSFKGRVHCFSMQVVISKCFLLNAEKKFGADPSCRFREKRTL